MRLRVYNLHWLPHMQEQQDICAHGAVEVQIGNELFEQDDEADWCVSAGALFLLRSLDRDHTPQSPIGEQLIPHCGHEMYRLVGKQEVEIHTCNIGIDWEVYHLGSSILVRTVNGTEEYLSSSQWHQLVTDFADSVASFYIKSLPKEPKHTYELEAFTAFQIEWMRHRGKAFLSD